MDIPGCSQRSKSELLPHLQAEQEVFYSRLEMGRSQESRQFGHGTSEHKMVEEQVQKLIRLDNLDSPISEEWTAELKVLQDLIEHHVGEEQSTGFSCAREEFTKERLEAMRSGGQTRKA